MIALSRRLAVVLLFPLAWAFAGQAVAAPPPPRTPLQLAQTVEARAGASDFGQLAQFGSAAAQRSDREGLNRLYHTTWIYLNQGEFDVAARWNRRLAQNAVAQHDHRYQVVAHLNELAIRYDKGENAAAVEMDRISRTEGDWFARAHATRLTAIALMDQDKIGEALKRLTDAHAFIPDSAPFADTARAGLWEVAGVALMKLNDFDGAAAAFGRFEIDFTNPAYPRPDFDSLYNLSRLSVQLGDQATADKLSAAHHRLAERSGLESLKVYDASLCAVVADARNDPHGVLNCLAPYGRDLGAAAFLASRLLPLRAIALARLGRLDEARADAEELRRREAAGMVREQGFSDLPHVQAEILFAEGRSAEAFTTLRDWQHGDQFRANKRFSAGIRQVTGDMQEQLDQRRQQLDTAKANTRLQHDMLRAQSWVVGIVAAFLLSAVGVLIWQFRLAGHLRVARAKAEAANLSKGEFLANMSHEIRTPLNGVIAMADTLSRQPLQPREQEMVEVIRSSGMTLERLLSDILDSAKIESGEVRIEHAPFHLGDAVRATAALWEAKAEDKGVDLVVTIDPALDHGVIGDAVRVRQIAANLISNALKFTEAGEVRVTLAPNPAGDQVRLTVADSGVGFDDAQKARIFGRFQQADGSITRRFGGTGLGLAISRDLAELMGGSLDCRSRPGEGAVFWLDLPLPEAQLTAAAVAPVPTETGGALRILLADDHPANRKVVEIMLSDADVQLSVAENGQEALDLFRAEPFDLVLMDMQMPVMDGLTATTAIRAHEAAQGLGRTPVIMLTANAMSEHVEAGRAAGADGHLAKPITLATLFAAIESALGGSGSEPIAAAA